MTRSLWCALLLGWVLLPGRAHAHNLDHVRTPVDWSGAPCLTVIDRSVDGPIYPLTYAIPFEDTMLSEDEPPDSRRHQFFAFCRDHYFEDQLPNWISLTDLDVAVGLGLGLYDGIDLEYDVLDQAQRWQDCFMRINADDERRPITFAAAAEPVAWDTGSLAPGTYVVEAYTWEPWFNRWTEHPGVFRIIDDPSAAHPPAAALTFPEQVVMVGDQATLSGCVDAMPGATMDLAWALGGSGVDPQWQVFASDLPVRNGSFTIPFAGPEPAIGHYLLVRLDVEDSLGRGWTAYSSEYIGVIGKPPTPTDSGDESEDDGGSEESGEPATDDPGAAAGCACQVGPRAEPLASFWPIMLIMVPLWPWAPIRRLTRRAPTARSGALPIPAARKPRA
jgi:hypothetical protein